MSGPAGGVVFYSLAALALVLAGIASWDAAGGARNPVRKRALHYHLPAGVHDALEVRLLVWAWIVILLWTRFVRPDLPGVRVRSDAVWFGAGMVPFLLAVATGWVLGRTTAFPSGLRRLLGPFHGVAMLALWARATAVSRRGGRRIPLAPAAPSPAEAAPDAREGVHDLASLPLEDLMVPRSQVAALEGDLPAREAVRIAARSPHTLYPVYGETVDQPLGLVRILDLGQPESLDRPVRQLARPVPVVPETMKGLDLLEDLVGAPVAAALVVDEFGGMAGFVTVEDLIEVLVGELVGEHEVARARIAPLADGSWRIEGTASVEEFNARFGPLLPEGEYETVAGFFLERAGRIPQVGDELSLPGVTLEVAERTERRILWLRAEVPGSPASVRDAARPPRAPRVPPG